jgi:hypothetical protein
MNGAQKVSLQVTYLGVIHGIFDMDSIVSLYDS